MHYYKAPDNSLHALSDYDIDNGGERFLPDGCMQITESEADAIRAANTLPPPIPKIVTMRQARLALLNAGLLSAVNNSIASMPGVEGDAARIEWEFSSEVHRDKALVQSLAPVLNMTPSQLDELFVSASLL